MKNLVDYIKESQSINEGKIIDKLKGLFSPKFRRNETMNINTRRYKSIVMNDDHTYKQFNYDDQIETGYTLYEAGLVIDIYWYEDSDKYYASCIDVQEYFNEHPDVWKPLDANTNDERTLYYFLPGLEHFKIDMNKLNDDEIRESINSVYRIPNIHDAK